MLKTARGFTLIEIAVVLVIIGLIVGGVLVGQSLVAAAAVRSQVSQIEKLNTSVNTFYGKYGYLPGDIPPATAAQFGLFQMTTCPTPGGSGCGNGDGIINSDPSGGAWYYSLAGEPLVFWRHLSDARMIEGSYGASLNTAGEQGCTGGDGKCWPPLKVSDGGLVVMGSPAAPWQNPTSRNYLFLTIVSTQMGGHGGFYSPEGDPVPTSAAYAIDQKIDDGIPNAGRVMATSVVATGFNGASVTAAPTAPTAACASGSAYAITLAVASAPNCTLRIQPSF